jgi:hypothetical protein
VVFPVGPRDATAAGEKCVLSLTTSRYKESTKHISQNCCGCVVRTRRKYRLEELFYCSFTRIGHFDVNVSMPRCYKREHTSLNNVLVASRGPPENTSPIGFSIVHSRGPAVLMRLSLCRDISGISLLFKVICDV